jgi:hypothetical protein
VSGLVAWRAVSDSLDHWECLQGKLFALDAGICRPNPDADSAE